MADAEFSAARKDRLKAAMVKLVAAQLHLESTLDALLLKLPSRTSHHPSSSSVQSPPSPPPSRLTAPPCLVPMQHNQSPLPTPLPTPTSSTMPTPPSMPPSLPMLTAPPCPAPVQPFLPPLSGLLPMPALHLLNLGLVRTAISFNKLISIVPLYGTAMTAYKLQPVHRNRPRDPGITFGSHALKPQHLEDKVFLTGARSDR
ncbi:hypothetical protein HKD37_01G000122 [Glycine soja]